MKKLIVATLLGAGVVAAAPSFAGESDVQSTYAPERQTVTFDAQVKPAATQNYGFPSDNERVSGAN